MDAYYDFEESGQGKQVVVGVCAMEKKTLSKPMKEILTRLEEFEYIKTYIFSEKIILEDPVEKWPIVDCLISFHSKVTEFRHIVVFPLNEFSLCICFLRQQFPYECKIGSFCRFVCGSQAKFSTINI